MKQLTLFEVAHAGGIPSVPGRVVRLFRRKVCGREWDDRLKSE